MAMRGVDNSAKFRVRRRTKGGSRRRRRFFFFSSESDDDNTTDDDDDDGYDDTVVAVKYTKCGIIAEHEAILHPVGTLFRINVSALFLYTYKM